MQNAMTFGERLTALMRKKHLSVAELARKAGYRSKTSLVRLMKDEARYSGIEDCMNRLEQTGEWPCDGEEMKALRQSMEVSRLGREVYVKYRALWRLMGMETEPRSDMRLESFGMASAKSLSELTREWLKADQLHFLLVNAGYESIFGALEELLAARPELDIRIEHYLIARGDPVSLTEQMNALKTVFNDARYQGFCRMLPTEEKGYAAPNHGLTGDAVLVSGRNGFGDRFCQLLIAQSNERGLLYENKESEQFPAFFRKGLERFCRDATPIKAKYPEKNLLEGLLSLSRRYLECERDRRIYCVAPNVCFELIPYEILSRMMLDSALKGLTMEDERVQELAEIQAARYANIHGKKKPSTFILDGESLKAFVRTGYAADHVIEMRAFTPDDRAAILMDVCQKARDNELLRVFVLKPEVRIREMMLITYESLGIYLLDAHTQYDVGGSHSETFLPMPDFAATLESFFEDELIAKGCYSAEESLDMLEGMAEELMEN